MNAKLSPWIKLSGIGSPSRFTNSGLKSNTSTWGAPGLLQINDAFDFGSKIQNVMGNTLGGKSLAERSRKRGRANAKSSSLSEEVPAGHLQPLLLGNMIHSLVRASSRFNTMLENIVVKAGVSQYGATNHRIAVARVTLRRGETSGAEPHTKGVGRQCLKYDL